MRSGQPELLAKSQHGDEGFVDAPLLFRGDVADQIAKPATVDGSHLLYEHPRDRPEQIDFWPE